MKKLNIMLTLVGVLLITIGCEKKIDVAFTTSIVDIPAEGGEVKASLTSNGDWMVNSYPEWLIVTPKRGSGDAQLTLTALANSTGNERIGEIKVSSKDNATSMTVMQEFMPTAYRGYFYDPNFCIEAGNIKEGERVYIDETYRVKFEGDDKVMLYNIDSENPSNSQFALYVVESESNQPILTPYQTDHMIDDQMKTAKYAFYPGNNIVVNPTLLSNQNKSTFKLMPVQKYLPGRIAKESLYIVAKINTGNIFAFRNICGVLAIKFYATTNKTIKSISLTDNYVNLVGDVTLKVDKVDPGRMMDLFLHYSYNDPVVLEYMQHLGCEVTAEGHTLTLDCDEGVALGNTAATATTFYFVLRPMALKNGFNMLITFTDGTTKTISTNKNNTIRPNTLKVFPTAFKVD